MSSALETVGPRAGAAPLAYTLTETGTVDLQSAFAHFDGTAASGDWRPALTIRAQNGTILSRTFPTDTLATGDTADVTYAPFLRTTASATDPPGTELDYVEATSTLVVTGTTPGTSDLFILGNPVAYDGATRVLVEVWCPYLDVARAAAQKAVVLSLFEGATELGWVVNLESPTSVGAGKLSETVSGQRYMTPAAGTHTYSIRAFKNDAATVADVGARPGGAGDYMPAFMRVTRA